MESDGGDGTDRRDSSASTEVPSSPELSSKAVKLEPTSETAIEAESDHEPEIHTELEKSPQKEVGSSKPKRKYVRHKKTNTKKQKTSGVTSTNIASFANATTYHSITSVSDTIDTDIAEQYHKLLNAPKYNLNSEELFCVCRRPDNGELMVACDGCDEWYHFKCMKLDKKHSRLISNYFCKFCTWQGKGQTLWKRKCRLSTCLNPIADNSKYCSRDHGLLFMKESLLDKLLSQNKLGVSEVKCVLDQSKDIESLNNLGLEFPKLEIKESDLPQDVQEQLDVIERKLSNLRCKLPVYDLRKLYLSKLKDKVKSINEKLTNKILQAHVGTSKKTKTKKKIEICGYNSQLILPLSVWEKYTGTPEFQEIMSDSYSVSDDLINEIEEHRETDTQFDDICILDKRSCFKHNPWLTMFWEEVEAACNKTEKEISELGKEREMIFKNYSIHVYENL